MRPVVLTTSSVEDLVARVDYRQPNFKIGMGVAISATGTFSVQHTFDDPANFNGVTDWKDNAVWFPHGTLAGSANADGNYFFPIQGIKLDVTATTGDVTLTILQGS